jgi:hypothetical protein
MTPTQLIECGLALVPIPERQKGPRAKDWNQKQNCIVDVTMVSFLGTGNIGLAHAYCTPRPTCAIDLDNYRESKKWLAKQSVDLDALLFAKDAVVIHSGKVNSLKLLYKLPVGQGPIATKAIKGGSDNGMMLEFRCATAEGLTVQDVLPPSIHPSGTVYQWMGEGSVLAMPEIPAALLAIWMGLITAKKVTVVRVTTSIPETPRERARVEDMLQYVSADCSYDIYRNVTWAVLSTGWSYAEEIAECWCRTAPDRFEEDDFFNVVNSYDGGRLDSSTLGTIVYLARAGGWNG